MKLLRLVIAGAVVMAAVSPVTATDQDIDITATVWGFCTIAGSLSPGADTVNWDSQITAGMITPTPTDRTYAVVCNRATDVTLTSVNGALTTGSAAATGFENLINYTASASGYATIAAGSTATVAGASGNETLGTTVRPTAGAEDITVTITPIANTDPLVQGTYSDTLRLRITPQP